MLIKSVVLSNCCPGSAHIKTYALFGVLQAQYWDFSDLLALNGHEIFNAVLVAESLAGIFRATDGTASCQKMTQEKSVKNLKNFSRTLFSRTSGTTGLSPLQQAKTDK